MYGIRKNEEKENREEGGVIERETVKCCSPLPICNDCAEFYCDNIVRTIYWHRACWLFSLHLKKHTHINTIEFFLRLPVPLNCWDGINSTYFYPLYQSNKLMRCTNLFKNVLLNLNFIGKQDLRLYPAIRFYYHVISFEFLLWEIYRS